VQQQLQQRMLSNHLGTLVQQLTRLLLAPMLLSLTGVTILGTATQVQRVHTLYRRLLLQTTQITLATLITQVRGLVGPQRNWPMPSGMVHTSTQPGACIWRVRASAILRFSQSKL
jgi:hypothetical protein